MNETVAKRIFIQETNSIVEQWGFKLERTRNTITIYKRKKKDRAEKISLAFLNYYPEIVFRNPSISMYIYEVENVLKNINDKFSLDFRITKETRTLTYFGKNMHQRKLQLMEVNGQDNEQGVIESTNIVLKYIEHEVLPMFNLFDDIREIDKRINGEGENWGEQKDFNLGRYEAVRRFIIARLCKDEKKFEEFCEKRYAEINENLAKMNQPKLDRNDKNDWVNMTIKYLKENVEPIY